MKLKYILKKNLNIKNGYLIAIMITLILVVGGYFSYAVFTTTNESKGALNIITGNLYSYIDSTDLDVNKEVTLLPNEVRYVRIKLTNINTVDAKVNLYYSLSEASDKLEIGYIRSSDAPPTNAGYILEKSGSGNESKTIDVRIINNDTKNIKVSFGSDVGLETVPLDFPTGKSVLESLDGNPNIVKSYTYDQVKDSPTFCVTGEEATCQVNQCYDSEDIDSCPVGTIIRYRVADGDVRYFHVMKDDGEHLTMQQREKTTGLTSWVYKEDGGAFTEDGPLTALETLETVTNGWKYVNDQTFKMGETIFKDNAFTGCAVDFGGSYDYNGESYYPITCEKNTYTLDSMTRKARFITVQEAMAVGCKYPTNSFTETATCPVWMYNYLSYSTDAGGTVNDFDSGSQIHTMTARTEDYVGGYNSWIINYSGNMQTTSTGIRATIRAVVEVNKR